MWSLTGKCYAFTKDEKVADGNSARLRGVIADYIRKRKSGEVKSDLKDESDIMSQMFAVPDIFSDDDIIDEVIDFLTAGTQTTQYTI